MCIMTIPIPQMHERPLTTDSLQVESLARERAALESDLAISVDRAISLEREVGDLKTQLTTAHKEIKALRQRIRGENEEAVKS